MTPTQIFSSCGIHQAINGVIVDFDDQYGDPATAVFATFAQAVCFIAAGFELPSTDVPADWPFAAH